MRKILLGSVLFFGLLQSCSKATLDEIDRNPNQLTDAPLTTLLPSGIMAALHAYAGTNNQNTSAVVASGIMSEQFTSTGTGASLKGGINLYSSPTWNNSYVALRTFKNVEEKATAAERWGYVGIAKMMSAFTLANLVDLFGDVPYSQAFDPRTYNQPAFDKAQDLYPKVQALLDEAIQNFDKATTAISRPTKDDLILNGNMALWKKSAYALQARLHNRLSNVDPTGSATKALQAIANSFAGPSGANIYGESLTAGFFANDNNNGNPSSIGHNLQPDKAVSAGMITALQFFLDPAEPVTGDPRTGIWLTTINGSIVPAPAGTAMTDVALNGNRYSKSRILQERAAPLPLLTYTELKFIEAEAQLRLGNTAAANTAYETAVRTALVQASQFRPASALTATAIADYTNRANVFPGAAGLTLRHIIYQKYIFQFQFGQAEAYNDFRRTGLIPVTDPNGQPFRFPYPLNEVTRNKNTPQDINEQSVYASNTKLFWAK